MKYGSPNVAIKTTASTARGITIELERHQQELSPLKPLQMSALLRSARCTPRGNGAGKSTLMNIISGTFAPAQARSSFEGRPVNRMTPDLAASGIAICFQHPAILGDLTVLKICVAPPSALFEGRPAQYRKGNARSLAAAWAAW